MIADAASLRQRAGRVTALHYLPLTALTACDKKDAPHASVPAPAATPARVSAAAQVEAAPAVPPSQIKKAVLDCDDRTIVLEAPCSPLNLHNILACTKQLLLVMASPGGAVEAARQFVPQPAADGDWPLVDQKISALSCKRRHRCTRDRGRSVCWQQLQACAWQEVHD